MSNPIRKTTKYAFNVGYVLIATAMFMVIFGVFRGIITESNISEILWALLIPAAGFFGIVTTRAGASEIASISAAAEVSTNPPASDATVETSGETVSVTANEIKTEPEKESVKDVWNVPPTIDIQKR